MSLTECVQGLNHRGNTGCVVLRALLRSVSEHQHFILRISPGQHARDLGIPALVIARINDRVNPSFLPSASKSTKCSACRGVMEKESSGVLAFVNPQPLSPQALIHCRPSASAGFSLNPLTAPSAPIFDKLGLVSRRILVRQHKLALHFRPTRLLDIDYFGCDAVLGGRSAPHSERGWNSFGNRTAASALARPVRDAHFCIPRKRHRPKTGLRFAIRGRAPEISTLLKAALFKPLLQIYGCLLELWKGKPAIRRVGTAHCLHGTIGLHAGSDRMDERRYRALLNSRAHATCGKQKLQPKDEEMALNNSSFCVRLCCPFRCFWSPAPKLNTCELYY